MVSQDQQEESSRRGVEDSFFFRSTGFRGGVEECPQPETGPDLEGRGKFMCTTHFSSFPQLHSFSKFQINSLRQLTACFPTQSVPLITALLKPAMQITPLYLHKPLRPIEGSALGRREVPARGLDSTRRPPPSEVENCKFYACWSTFLQLFL